MLVTSKRIRDVTRCYSSACWHELHTCHLQERTIQPAFPLLPPRLLKKQRWHSVQCSCSWLYTIQQQRNTNQHQQQQQQPCAFLRSGPARLLGIGYNNTASSACWPQWYFFGHAPVRMNTARSNTCTCIRSLHDVPTHRVTRTPDTAPDVVCYAKHATSTSTVSPRAN